MPFDDWQFYVVTAAGLWGVWAVVRPFIPDRNRPGCPGCDTGTSRSRSKRTRLTIRGR